MSETIEFSYAEFGKKFYWLQQTTDYDFLDASSRAVSIILDPFYVREFATRPGRGQPIPSFYTKPPGFGGFTVALVENIREDGYSTGTYMFVQLQTRKEQDRHLSALFYALKVFNPESSDGVTVQLSPDQKRRLDILKYWDKELGFNHDDHILSEFLLGTGETMNGLLVALGNFANRPFNQAHMTLLTADAIKQMTVKGSNLYARLLCYDQSGTPRLKDYWIRNEFGKREEPPAIKPRPLTFQQDDERDVNAEYLEGLTNLLVDRFSPARIRDPRSEKVVVITPGLNFLDRLRLFQAAHRRVIEIIGVITFSLDFITKQAQIYLANSAPPNGFFRNHQLFSENNLREYARRSPSFFKTVEGLNRDKRGNPTIHQLLANGLFGHDLLLIDDVLSGKLDDIPSDEHTRVFLENFYKLGAQIFSKLFNLVLRSEHTKSEMIRLAPQYLEEKDLDSFFLLILKDTINKETGRTAGFFFLYAQLIEDARESDQIKDLFLSLIRKNSSTCLRELSPVCSRIILFDLLKYNRESILSFADNLVTDAVFSFPGDTLNQVIVHLQEKRFWNQNFTGELAYLILINPVVWNEDQVSAVISALKISLSDLYYEGLKYFLTNNPLERFVNISDPQERSQILRNIVSRIGESLSHIWGRLDDTLKINFRKMMVYGHSQVDLLIEWAQNLAAIAPSDFLADYPDMIALYARIEPSTKGHDYGENGAVVLLRGTIYGGNRNKSIQKACVELGLRDYYFSVINTLLDKCLSVSTDDIDNLIGQLPESNPLLAKLIMNCPDECYASQIMNLSARSSMMWLTKTFNQLRNHYINGNVDVLYERLSQIDNPDPDFVSYIVFHDRSSYPKTNWVDYQRRVTHFYREICKKIESTSLYKDFVEMVIAITPPVQEIRSHWAALAALAKWNDHHSEEVVGDVALGCVLVYAFEQEKYPTLSTGAQQTLSDIFELIVNNKEYLYSDVIYSLHYYYEQSGMDQKKLNPLKDEGWRRRYSERSSNICTE